VQPDLVVNFGTTLIAASNNGEFGGEVVVIDESNNVVLIKEMNVEDIHPMPFGLVVTSGLAHLRSNDGEINLVTKDFKLENLYNLVGMPSTSWILHNGDWLINSYPWGS
jgi:hypothetical protein